jgi:two-component system LytT family response regulator
MSRSEDEPLRVLVVDDEEPARALLADYLLRLPGVEQVGDCANGFEAVKKVGELQPDLLLLDVQLPKLNGFEVLELLGERAPAVIFTTAYDQYALRAFEVHAVDYLLKPFTVERLAEAIERFRSGAGAKAEPRALERSARATPYLERILIRDGGQIHVLPCERIDYVEARDDEVLFHAGKDKLRKAQRLAELEAELDPRRFVRIHRSYLLNVERLARLELYAKDSRLAILREGGRLPVSRAGYQRLRELL